MEDVCHTTCVKKRIEPTLARLNQLVGLCRKLSASHSEFDHENLAEDLWVLEWISGEVQTTIVIQHKIIDFVRHNAVKARTNRMVVERRTTDENTIKAAETVKSLFDKARLSTGESLALYRRFWRDELEDGDNKIIDSALRKLRKLAKEGH